MTRDPGLHDGAIQVDLRVPPAWAAQARFAFETLAYRWMIPVRFSGHSNGARVIYAPAPLAAPPGAILLPFDPALYDPRTDCRARSQPETPPLWVRAGVQREEEIDLVGGVYRLLTYQDEHRVPEASRDRRGTFPTSALPEERFRLAAEPLVEHHARVLLGRILRAFPHLEGARIDRWPGGRRYALAPSHDADAVHLGAALELLTNGTKWILRRDSEHGALLRLGLRWVGRKSTNPFFGFPVWKLWEGARGLRSAFYAYHRPPGTRGDLNDVKSGLAGAGTDWRRLREMADQGWEFGLHPSIRTRERPDGFSASKAWLEAHLRRPVHGLRHHYWALDWRDPIATHRQHQAAGFAYDSSIAWRDCAGFRAGTALPYRPFDPVAGRSLDLVEIPCVLMDGQILRKGPGGTRSDERCALSLARAPVDRVLDCGGVLTVNWHQETAFNRLHYRGYLEMLDAIYRPILESSEVWTATPYQISLRWRELTPLLLPDSAG